jgi:predicted small secreted protein
MSKIRYIPSVLLAACLLFTGCQTTPDAQDISSFVNDAQDIAEGATQIALLSDPESRVQLEKARDALAHFESLPDGQATSEDLLKILTALPLDGLKSPKGQIYVLGGKIIVRRFVRWLGDPAIDVAQVGYVKQFARAFKTGIDSGLLSSPPPNA